MLKEEIMTEKELKELLKEYDLIMALGVMGVDGWKDSYDEYMNKLKAAGMDEVKAELQKQLDEYLANK